MKVRSILKQPDNRYTIDYVDENGIIHLAYDCSAHIDHVETSPVGGTIRCVFLTFKPFLAETEI